MRDCDLLQLKNQFSKTLSGGQKRKLSLAMAIINHNKIIILDEPSSGMDPNARIQLWSIINNLKSANKTIIFTTHYLEEADFLCDRIAIINKGKLLILGTSDFIKKKFGVGYTLTVQNNLTFYDSQMFKQLQQNVV